MNAIRHARRPLLIGALAFGLAGATPAVLALLDAFASLRPLEDERLEALRGGFENAQGFQFAFAIERAVVVNGELITSTRLVIDDLSSLLAGGVPSVQLIASVRNVVQDRVANAVSPASSTPSPPPRTPPPEVLAALANLPAAGAPAPAMTSIPAANAAPNPALPPTNAAPQTNPAPATPAVPPTTPAPAANAAPAPGAAPTTNVAPAPPSLGPLVLTVNAGGTTILIPNGNALATAVQNSAHQTTLQTLTTIDALISSMASLRAQMLSEAVRLQAATAR
jgi:hypothetical protein